jgi:hypothetical protein
MPRPITFPQWCVLIDFPTEWTIRNHLECTPTQLDRLLHRGVVKFRVVTEGPPEYRVSEWGRKVIEAGGRTPKAEAPPLARPIARVLP